MEGQIEKIKMREEWEDGLIGWIEGWIDGWMAEWIDEWIDGLINEWVTG